VDTRFDRAALRPQLGQQAIVAVVKSSVATKRFTGTSAFHGSGPSLPSARLTSTPSIRTITRTRSADRACNAGSIDNDNDNSTTAPAATTGRAGAPPTASAAGC
jgi:hypothetical protein